MTPRGGPGPSNSNMTNEIPNSNSNLTKRPPLDLPLNKGMNHGFGDDNATKRPSYTRKTSIGGMSMGGAMSPIMSASGAMSPMSPNCMSPPASGKKSRKSSISSLTSMSSRKNRTKEDGSSIVGNGKIKIKPKK